MTAAKVLRLDDYRDRRLHRRHLARALYGGDRPRQQLLEHLGEVAVLTGADRVGAVWVDEYGAGLVHPHVVLDLLSNRTRRAFSAEPLQRAWECGIPGAYDQASDPETTAKGTMAIALGSDGARNWFLVAESIARRAPLPQRIRRRLMFLAGECSALVLHRDLSDSAADEVGIGFVGRDILEDLDGHESDEARKQAIIRRFVVGRLARRLVEEDLVIPDDQRREQVHRARRELEATEAATAREAALLDEALTSYGEGDYVELGSRILEMGEAAESDDHYRGALGLYRSAYDIGAAVGDCELTINAARQTARALRKQALWSEADAWYQMALEIAQVAGLEKLVALVFLGLGLIKRHRGNLPAARSRFYEARRAAELSGDADAIATVHQDLLGLEQAAGNVGAALRHGWAAVDTFEDEVCRTRWIASLGGVLQETGDLEAAEDAWLLVAHRSDESYYLAYAYDALAFLAASRGDEQAFHGWAARCDAQGWESGAAFAKAEILYYRGLSLGALERWTDAEAWLRRAITFAQDNEINQVLFDAEAALASIEDAARPTLRAAAPVAPPEVREGLRTMRQQLSGFAG